VKHLFYPISYKFIAMSRLLATTTMLLISLILCVGSYILVNHASADVSKSNGDPFAHSNDFNSNGSAGKVIMSQVKASPEQNEDDEEPDINSKDIIRGTNGNDFIEGTENDDIIYGLKGDDQIYGFDGNDRLIGGKGDDIVDGGPDNDTIYGNTGNDFVAGNTGMDSLIAGKGDDILRGKNALISEAEPDSFNCGPGEDTMDDFNSLEGDVKTGDCE
jgi:Ca2+-binding RTX toxin-like protein